MKEEMIVGVVRTNKIGSDCEFGVCGKEYWESLTPDEQEKLLIEAAYESGVFEIYLKD